jgi:hypothetical protein
MVPLADDESAVAVNPADGPTADAAPGSVARDVIRPVSVPTEVLRCTCEAGAVQLVVADDLSAQ